MRVKVVSWAAWASNPANGTASCRECQKVIRGVDFYEAETLDAKGRRFVCPTCVEEQKLEVVKDFGPLAESALPSRPLVELLPSHKAAVHGMILAAVQAHEGKFHSPLDTGPPAPPPEEGQSEGPERVEPPDAPPAPAPPAEPEKPGKKPQKKRAKKESA